jgi:hypothetical protein
MRPGELLTRFSIWIALAGYFSGAVIFALSRGRARLDRLARLAWTLGCLALAVHIVLAFNFYHHWSHDSAYAETARETNAVAGLDWGGGVYINYIILSLWIVDTAWWWRGLELYRRRSAWITFAWHGLLLFIIFNATVIFESGALRWIGLTSSMALISSWICAPMTRKPGNN